MNLFLNVLKGAFLFYAFILLIVMGTVAFVNILFNVF